MRFPRFAGDLVIWLRQSGGTSVAHVNDRLEPGFTWIPRYAAVIGPYGPSLDQMDELLRAGFDDFLLLMPGSRTR